MTFHEAEHILDTASAILQNQNKYAQIPMSALQQYDLLDILAALKLRVANEYLLFSGRPDFEQLFSDGLKLYDSIPWSIMGSIVADEQFGQFAAKRVMCPVDPATMELDKRFASIETPSGFGAFCKTLDPTDPKYWQKVYKYIGIEYSPYCPQGNEPVKVR